MRGLFGVVLGGICMPISLIADEGVRRCGWFTNPSPANVALTDRHGDWWLSMQGRGGVPGFDHFWETRAPTEWVQMSPSGYGFGCACVEGVFGPAGSGDVLRVTGMDPLPLARCAEDVHLPERDLSPPHWGDD